MSSHSEILFLCQFFHCYTFIIYTNLQLNHTRWRHIEFFSPSLSRINDGVEPFNLLRNESSLNVSLHVHSTFTFESRRSRLRLCRSCHFDISSHAFTILLDFSSRLFFGLLRLRQKKDCRDGDANPRPHPRSREIDALDSSTTVGRLSFNKIELSNSRT